MIWQFGNEINILGIMLQSRDTAMIAAIKKFFETNLALLDADAAIDKVHDEKLQLASAALLIEVINSDHQADEREWAEFATVLKHCLQLQEDKLDELIKLAKVEAKQATSLYEFTQLINEHYAYRDKLVLMENMWRVAFADSVLDKYEVHLIRRVSELIYVSHSDFIRTKLKVRDKL